MLLNWLIMGNASKQTWDNYEDNSYWFIQVKVPKVVIAKRPTGQKLDTETEFTIRMGSEIIHILSRDY